MLKRGEAEMATGLASNGITELAKCLARSFPDKSGGRLIPRWLLHGHGGGEQPLNLSLPQSDSGLRP
jgi:hypothetical protein